MKKVVLVIILITSAICAMAQKEVVDSIKLNRTIQNSEYIFEGKVIDQCSYSTNGMIYTAHYIQLSRAFKGNLQSGIVAVITQGGRYRIERLMVSHTANFYKGFTGVVFCKTSPYGYDSTTCNKLVNNPNLTVISNKNAIIEYSADGYNSIAHGISSKFNTLGAVYDYIQSKTKTPVINFNQPQITQLFNDEATKLKHSLELEITNNTDAKFKSSGATNDVKYIFANTKVTGTTVKYFECDLQINANNASTYFDQGAFRIKFNSIAFGTNIATATIATMGANFPVSTYPIITKINKQTDVVSIWVKSAVYVQPRTNISTTYQTLVHLKIPFVECNSLPTFKLDTFYNVLAYSTFASFATNPTKQTYSSVDLTDVNVGLNCQPIVTKVYSLKDTLKTTRKVAGGVKEQVQLEGKHFGDSYGTLYMKSADDEGTWVPLDEYDINSWNDTAIKFTVPSIVLDANYSTPGSGNVGVRNVWKGVIDTILPNSTRDLTVDYSIANWIDNTPSFYKAPLILASNNNVDSSYTYYLHSNVTPKMKECISAAINKWRCFTGVHFKLATTTKTNTIANDNVNMIKVVYDSDSATIMAAYLRDTICNTLLVAPPFAVSNIDIMINSANESRFFYDTTGTLDKPKDSIDFYSDILHELGHAHALFHVRQTNDLMYFNEVPDFIPSNDRNVKFNIDNRNGGDWVVLHSIDLTPYAYFNSCSYNIPMAKQATSCRTVSNSLQEQKTANKMLAYPNPTQGNVTFDFSMQDYWAIQVYNTQGVLVKELRNELLKTVELNTTEFTKGLYIIIATNGTETINTKIICE